MSASASASASDSFAPGTPIGDHFVVVRKLGDGGMGEVYLAENLNVPDKKYAIKVLRPAFSNSPRFVELLRDEAKKQARLEHDNVVGMYDFLLWGGSYCLIQSFIDGETLADLIAAQPAGLDLPVALPLMTGILEGLDYAHEVGILHCDVKPANVIVDHDGRPRVTDFGISRDIGAARSEGGVEGAGTAEYMSPEQAVPPYAIDHRSDVFSAGVLFFEMLSGRLPFEIGPEQVGLALPQLHRDAPDIRSVRPDIPEPIARIVATALQRDPAARFQGCEDFRDAIDRYVRGRQRLRLLRRFAVVALVVGVVGGAGLYEWRESVREQARAAEARNVREALANAVTSRNLLCREWIDYQIKLPGVEKAREAGLPDLAQRFQAKLAGMQANMDRHVANYAVSMRRLRSNDTAIVDAAIGELPVADVAARDLAQSLKADELALRRGAAPASKDDLLRRCPAPERAS